MTRIAIVIPYYQRGAGILRRALESVLLQQLPPDTDVDIIVVNDGSPRHAQLDTDELVFTPPFRLTLVEQSNGGVATARNTGLDHAKDADFIAFLDSDDWWEPAHLARGLAALKDCGGDFYFCDYTWPGADTDSRFRHARLDANRGEQTRTADIFAYKSDFPLEILERWPVHLSATMIRNVTLGNIRFDRRFNLFSASEDQMYFLECAQCTGKIFYDCQPGAWGGDGINVYRSRSPGDFPFVLSRLGNILCHVHVWRKMPSLSLEAKRCNRRHLFMNFYLIIRSELSSLKHKRKIHAREIFSVMRQYRKQVAQ